MIALKLAKRKDTISDGEYKTLVKELAEVPEKGRLILENGERIKRIAEKYHEAENALYLGRGYLSRLLWKVP